MKKELKNILVPVDFNPSSSQALKYALNLVHRFEGKIVLLNVLETPGLLADFFSSGDHLVKITDQTKDKLFQLSESVRKEHPGIEVISRVERGKPYEKILEVAKEIQARFIVLGENHQGNDAQQDLGTTVYHVTLRSPVPVLTVKGTSEEFGDSLLVPLDLTRQTDKQLSSALLYALNYDLRISLVSALIGGIKMEKSRIYQKLQDARNTLEKNGVTCDIKLFERSEKPPFTRVIEYSKQIQADMILVMTHQEGYTYDNYIGAFAHHIINESQVPVLSLTASASNLNFKQLLTDIVDPVGMLFR
jgi:nucleotide-binding universal stress UspA family protein